MRIVVTGGSGKAGRAVVRDLLEHGAGALVVHAEEEQSLCADRGHPAVLPGWRCKEDEPLLTFRRRQFGENTWISRQAATHGEPGA